VVHAGTLNGNPLALAACDACIDRLSRDGVLIYTLLRSRGERLRRGLEQILRQIGAQVITQGEGAVFQVSFMESPARTYRDTLAADRGMYSDFSLAMLDEGVLLLPDGRWYLLRLTARLISTQLWKPLGLRSARDAAAHRC
jgi:glutamate-1-semialdehyde 2,1-aminomutase